MVTQRVSPVRLLAFLILLWVSHFFLDLISGSQYLQHRIDLTSAGLVENPNTVCTLAERRG
jgi:hypothetical protein